MKLPIRSFKNDNLIFLHTMKLGKQQLRRWVREEVRFPVEATLHDGSLCHGVLYDLSAGGILLGIPVEIPGGEHIRIRFELPSFGVEDVEIEILRNLGRKIQISPIIILLRLPSPGPSAGPRKGSYNTYSRSTRPEKPPKWTPKMPK
jgi:PilZ domain.